LSIVFVGVSLHCGVIVIVVFSQLNWFVHLMIFRQFRVLILVLLLVLLLFV